MRNHIADSLQVTLTNGHIKSWEKISQIFVMGNYLTISGIPNSPEVGNVLVTERFSLTEVNDMLIKFN